MKIAIIGAGNVGTTLGHQWHRSGHEIVYGVRDVDDEKYRALKEYAGLLAITEAARLGEIIVIATPWGATEAVVRQLADAVKGKILIDCTNPLKPDLSGLTVGHETSGGELVASWAEGAVVVKAFNTTGFNIMAKPVVNHMKTVMFVASDSDEARETVMGLAAEIDFDAVTFGGLASSRLLEPFALTWISLAYRFGMGRDFGFAIHRS